MLTRRDLLKLAAVSPALAATAEKAPLSVFDYSQVKLGESVLLAQFEQNLNFFLHLDEDRMLKIYRQRAGLPAPGPDMGGWYDDFCPGSHFGQYLSGLARASRVADSELARAKVKRLVAGLAQTMDPAGKFFVDHRYPGYTYDKLVGGLLDAYSCAGDRTAHDVLAQTTRAALPHMADRALTSEEMHQRPHKDETYTWDETYTFAENLFLASDQTGDRKYFDLGKRYLLDKGFFDPLSEGQNVLPGVHAYSHVNALSSGIQGYLKLGDTKYFRAVRNAVDMILKDQSYATGGWGPNEAFVEPGKGELGASIDGTHRHFESGCGAYSHFKLMRYLLALTRESRYGDSMERVLFNVAAGILPLQEDGSTFYYSDYHPSAQKSYIRIIPDATYRWDRDDHWPCCSGTFPQLTADYGISSYLRSGDGVYVILYAPSTLTWKQGTARCAIRQTTDYPSKNLVTLTVTTDRPADFTVHLRIPAWAGKNTGVAVNGRRVPDEIQPGFLPVRRNWKSGDKIELEIDQTLRFEPVDAQTPNQVALMRGPQVMFAMTDKQPKITRQQMARFETGGVPLWPFWAIRNEVYQTYWQVTA